MKTPTIEVWYVWKEYVCAGSEVKPRLQTPWADPMAHEFPFDLMFNSPEEAYEGKIEWGAEKENWILCRQTTEPISTRSN